MSTAPTAMVDVPMTPTVIFTVRRPERGAAEAGEAVVRGPERAGSRPPVPAVVSMVLRALLTGHPMASRRDVPTVPNTMIVRYEQSGLY